MGVKLQGRLSLGGQGSDAWWKVEVWDDFVEAALIDEALSRMVTQQCFNNLVVVHPIVH